MKLQVDREYEGDIQSVIERLHGMESRLRTRYRAETGWTDESTMSIGGPGVRGSVNIAGQKLHVELELSPVLMPLRSRIEKLLGKELDRVAVA